MAQKEDENVTSAIESVKQALALNREQLSRLSELHQFLVAKLKENYDLYNSAISDENEDEQVDEQSTDQTNLSTFIHPYFKDNRGFSAPENEDTLKLRELGQSTQLDLSVRKKHWSKNACKQLEQLVLSEYKGRSVSDLTESRNSLASRLQVLQSLVDERTSTEDLNNIERKKEKMAELTALVEERLADVSIPSREDSENLDWLRIAANMSSSFSDIDCKLKWINDLHPDINHEPFTSDEIEAIKEYVSNDQDDCNWTDIAEKISQPGKLRLSWQVCKYYQSHLNEETKRVGPLSDEERELLELLIAENTDKNSGEIDWQRVNYHMNGRTTSQLKLYWSKKNSLKKGQEWSRLEDRVLVAAVEKFGESSWNQVAHYVYGRTNRQCRERWTNRLSVKNRKGGNWSREEDERLVTLAPGYDFKWAQLQKQFPGRSERQLSSRFSCINHWVETGQEAKLIGDDSARSTMPAVIKSKSIDQIKSSLADRLASEEAITKYLEESREELKLKFEREHQVPVLIEDEADAVDREMTEFFAYHDQWTSAKTRIAQSANDTLLYDTLAHQLSQLIDGEQLEPENALQLVTQSAISQDVSRQVSRILSDDGEEKANLFILPPNLVTLRGLQGLLLQEDRLKKIVTDAGLNLEEEMSKYSLSDPDYRKQFTRFLSLFFWPLICSLENAPSISSLSPEMMTENNALESKLNKKKQISGLVHVRERQNWLFKSAVGEGNKLSHVFDAIRSAKNSQQQVNLTSEDLDAAFTRPSTSSSSHQTIPVTTVKRKSVGRKRKSTAQLISSDGDDSHSSSQTGVPDSEHVSRKSGRERRPKLLYDA